MQLDESEEAREPKHKALLHNVGKSTTHIDHECPFYRRSLMVIGWTEDHCAPLDEIAAEDHSYIATAAERARHENTTVLVGNGPMNEREDYQEATRIKERLYQESGPREHVRQRPDQPFAWHDEGFERVDPKTGWRW